MEQRWGFLSKWWPALQGRILYKKIERLDDAWAEHKFQLQVELPKRYESSSYRQGFALNEDDEAEFRLRMQRVREALALLAAVAHVDPKGWKHLLREKCRVKMGKKGEEKYEKEVPVEFVLKFDLNENKKTKGDESLGLDLLLFFDTSHHTEPSRDYVRALAKIAKMDESLKPPRQPGVDSEVPVRVHYSQDTKNAALKLNNISKAEKVILERWSSLEQEPVTAKTLRCTFVLQPMIALCDNGGCDAKMVKTMQTLLADNVWFSQLDLYPDRADDAAGMKMLALLMTRVFKGASSSGTVRNPTYHIETGGSGGELQLRQLQTLNLQCEVEMGAWEFGSVLSAVALNESTKNLWIRFYSNEKISLNKWMWLAYGVFSKRACGVESLTITEIDSMSVADIDALSSVLLSGHPEEVLAGLSGDQGIERRATLKSGAHVRWDIDDEGQMRRGSRPLTLSFEMYSVWTFADDGQIEWVNVVIPGFGHCQVRRGDLVFQEKYDQQMPVNKLASLTICFDKFKEERDEDDTGDDDDDRDDSNSDDIEAEGPNSEDGAEAFSQTDGLAHFLERVGSSLKVLSLDGPRGEIDENLILQHCPILEKLSLCGDHLRSQEYLRLRRSANSLLLEPRMSDEDAARLVEAYERNDTSDSEYLDLVTENRPFTPPQTTHSVVIDTGSYCSSTALPVILKSFLRDHGNAVVDNILSRHEVSVVEKIPSGGILVHVRSADAEKKLVGQEVMILGRKFVIKRQLPFIDKFYLDISGIRSSELANQLFMGLSAIGARPLFWTPRDVNMEAQVATPTWRFYFGQEVSPSCLKVRGFVTNQLAVGGHFYLARGKRSVGPPERATGFRQSPYAVVLPVGSDLPRHLQHETVEETNDAAQDDGINAATPNRRASAPGQMTESATQALSILASPIRQATIRNPNGNEPSGGWFSSTSEPGLQDHGHEQATQDQFDAEMESIPSDEDVDMLRHLETGFKRIEPSFADANPFEALEDMECNFEAFQPEIPEEVASGILIIPRLVQPNSSSGDQEPLPTKRRTTDLDKCSTTSPYLDEDIVVSAEETCLESHEDRITQNVQHLSPVKAPLHESKNMDQVIQSIRAMPVAWSTAFCSDLVSEGNDMKELADIHVLDRILASSGGAENDATFHQRVVASHLPSGQVAI
ncbi:hypothetical protein PF003_g13628 [Phytophthora fragariae]|nr:hypothetical protein PF003_g13628 [Phytophthora fragariae]